MNFYLTYYKNEGTSKSRYTIDDEALALLKEDLSTIASKENTKEFKLDFWNRVIYFQDLYDFFVTGTNVHNDYVDIKKDSRLKNGCKNFYSKTSQFYRVVDLWKRDVKDVRGYTWNSNHESEWKNYGLFIDASEKNRLDREDLNSKVNKALKNTVVKISPEVFDSKRTMAFYTIDEMKNVKYDENNFSTVGVMLTEKGFCYYSGHWDKSRSCVTNTNGWFHDKSDSIGVAVCDLYSVFPTRIKKAIEGVRTAKGENKRTATAVLFSLLNENYEDLKKINGLVIPEVTLRGRASFWNNIDSFARIEICGKDKFSVFTSHGSSTRDAHFTNINSALNNALSVFHSIDETTFDTRIYERDAQLQDNRINTKSKEAFIKKYKKENSFKPKKEYTFRVSVIRRYYDNDGSGREIRDEYKSFNAHNSAEALKMVNGYIEEFNRSERGYRPGWVGHKTMVLTSKKPSVY